jgi:elongation factor Ts
VSNPNSVKELRERTGAGFMDCKRALEHTGGDMDKAIAFLREKGIASAAKKAGRSANDGLVHSYIHGTGKLGVMAEINCETDFVARTDDFRNFVNDICMHVAAANPQFLSKEVVPAGALEQERLRLKVEAEKSGKTGPILEKIVEGRLNKFFEENCLLQQKFVKDTDKTIEELVKEMIGKLGENIQVRRFSRFQLGETLEAAPATTTH